MTTANVLAELSRQRAAALGQRDEATADEAAERLMSHLAELLELGQAAKYVAEASELLQENFAAVDSLHELTQALVEEDELPAGDGPERMVQRLVLLPFSVSPRAGGDQTFEVLDAAALVELQSRVTKELGLVGAELSFVPYVYEGAQLTRSSYDQLYNLMPAVVALQDAAMSELAIELLQVGSAKVTAGTGVVRYLLGLLKSPAAVDVDFVVDSGLAESRKSLPALAMPLIEKALGRNVRCLAVMELAPFFEGVTMGEQFGREATFTADVLQGLDMARVSPKATTAHIRLPENEADDDRVEVQLIGLDSVAVATAYWDILEPADPDGEIDLLMTALERLGVRTKPDASHITGYGHA